MAESSTLEVVNLKDGQRLSSWDFGSALDKEEGVEAEITCVVELRYANGDSNAATSAAATASEAGCTSKTTKLLIGVDKGVEGGLLCLFEPRRSKLEKCLSVGFC